MALSLSLTESDHDVSEDETENQKLVTAVWLLNWGSGQQNLTFLL